MSAKEQIYFITTNDFILAANDGDQLPEGLNNQNVKSKMNYKESTKFWILKSALRVNWIALLEGN